MKNGTLFAKLDRDIVNQATKPTQSNVWFPIITEHDVFLHMTRFLHISLFAVTCFTCYSQQEGIKWCSIYNITDSAVAFATFNIIFSSFEIKPHAKNEIDFPPEFLLEGVNTCYGMLIVFACFKVTHSCMI